MAWKCPDAANCLTLPGPGMINRKILKSRTAILIGPLIVLMLAAGAPGCDAGVSSGTSDRYLNAFVTDQVVEVRITMNQKDWDSLRANALEKQYVPADFRYDGELVRDVAVRTKGASSLQSVYSIGSPRFSLTVDFNLFDPGRTFRGLKKLNFDNGFRDPTYIRERLAGELFSEMGVPTPRESHVDLWVNDVHLGVYTQVEEIDKTFLKEHFSNDGGNLYRGAGALNWGKEELEANRAILAPEQLAASIADLQVRQNILQALKQQEPRMSDNKTSSFQQPDWSLDDPLLGLKTNEKHPDHTALFNLIDVSCNEPDETFPQAIEKVLDVDEVLRYLAVSSLIGYLDGYLNHSTNTYLYEVDGKFTLIPWDMVETFGIYGCEDDINGNWVNCTSREGMLNYYIDEPTCGPIAEFPLIKRLLSYQPYLNTYHGYYETLLNGHFSIGLMDSRIDRLKTLIQPYVENEQYKLFLPGDFEISFTKDVSGAIGLKTYVMDRNESVRQQLEGTRPSAGNGSGNKDLCQ
jgi:spore coat protein CotH